MNEFTNACGEFSTNDNYYKLDENSYVSEKQCAGLGRLAYASDDGTERTCLASAAECTNKGGYASETRCLTRAQCEESKLYKVNQITHTCEAKTCAFEGVCEVCVLKNRRYPYWNGEGCVSCIAGTRADSWVQPYLDLEGMQCTDECPYEAPVFDSDNVCVMCPEDTPFWDGFNCRQCADLYGDTRPFWNPMVWACQPKCPKALGVADEARKICKSCA